MQQQEVRSSKAILIVHVPHEEAENKTMGMEGRRRLPGKFEGTDVAGVLTLFLTDIG